MSCTSCSSTSSDRDLLNLNYSGTKQSRSSDFGSSVEHRHTAGNESTQSETPGKPLIIREWSEEVGLASFGVAIRDGDSDWQILAGDVGNGNITGVDCSGDTEQLSAVHCLGRGLDGQGREWSESDDIDVWAGAWHDEIREGSVGELGSAASQERCGRGDFLLQSPVETILLALLANDRANNGD